MACMVANKRAVPYWQRTSKRRQERCVASTTTTATACDAWAGSAPGIRSPRLYGGGVGEDGDVGVKLPAGLWLQRLRRQHHALAHSAALYLLQGQGRRLARHHLQVGSDSQMTVGCSCCTYACVRMPVYACDGEQGASPVSRPMRGSASARNLAPAVMCAVRTIASQKCSVSSQRFHSLPAPPAGACSAGS